MKFMHRMLKLAALALILGGGFLSLHACNTVQGVGEDFSAMGQSLADAAAHTNPAKK